MNFEEREYIDNFLGKIIRIVDDDWTSWELKKLEDSLVLASKLTKKTHGNYLSDHVKNIYIRKGSYISPSHISIIDENLNETFPLKYSSKST